jgi:cytidine deaminase
MSSLDHALAARLFDSAVAARANAYVPYSKFAIGAALLVDDGEVFVGCNVENLSFGLTICAERAAVCAAVAAGFRRLQAIMIVADSQLPITPCGACRQVLAELNPSCWVISRTLQGGLYQASLAELLPRPTAGILDHS